MTMFDFLYGKMPEYFDEKAILYHYTSVGVLNKFLEDDGDLYCTHFGALNDSSEMMIGLSIAEKFLRKKFNWSEMTCVWFREGYNLLVRSGNIVVPWVMSFSRAKDSLNQWNMYTNRETGGVAVGFEMGLLWDELLERTPGCYSKVALTASGEKGDVQDKAFELKLLPCLYAESDAILIEELFQEFLLPHEAAFRRIGDAITNKEIDPVDFTEAIFSILEVSSIVKHEAFKNEQEIRLVLLPMTKSLADCELVGGKLRWKTYVCKTRKEGAVTKPTLKALRGMIKEVMISPHGDTDMLWTIVRDLLDKYEMCWCELKRSTLPYNWR